MQTVVDDRRADRRRLLDIVEEIRRHEYIKARRGRKLTIEDRALYARTRHIMGS